MKIVNGIEVGDIYIKDFPRALYRRLKLLCAKEDVTLREKFQGLIERELEEKEG